MKKIRFVIECIGELLAIPFFCLTVYIFICAIA